MRGLAAALLTLLLAGCGTSEPPVALGPAYGDVAAAAAAVSACEAAGDLRDKTELISTRAEIDRRIAAIYGDAVLADLQKQAETHPDATMQPCPGDAGFRKYRDATAALSTVVGEE